jgi:hypothetical protein
MKMPDSKKRKEKRLWYGEKTPGASSYFVYSSYIKTCSKMAG